VEWPLPGRWTGRRGTGCWPLRLSTAWSCGTALYLTPDERDELDELAIACGLNRSAFVTSVARLALGEELDEVIAALVPGTDR